MACFLFTTARGKEAILSKAVLSLRSSEKEPPQISQMTIAGVPVLKVQRKTGVTYWVEHGKYAVSANEPAVLEEILGRLGGKSSSSAALTDSAGVQRSPFRSRFGAGGIFSACSGFEKSCTRVRTWWLSRAADD